MYSLVHEKGTASFSFWSEKLDTFPIENRCLEYINIELGKEVSESSGDPTFLQKEVLMSFMEVMMAVLMALMEDFF